MNWKGLIVLLVIVVFVGSLIQGALFGDDEIDVQVSNVEDSIAESSGDGTWSFTEPTCPRFDQLVDGEKITCHATAVGRDGAETPARFVVTLENCERGNGELASVRCEYASRWTVG